MKNLELNEQELKVLHTLLLDIPNREIERLGIDKQVYSHMAHKSVGVAKGKQWKAN
jgi:hypothetical protein